jgi:hypothetical protein
MRRRAPLELARTILVARLQARSARGGVAIERVVSCQTTDRGVMHVVSTRNVHQRLARTNASDRFLALVRCELARSAELHAAILRCEKRSAIGLRARDLLLEDLGTAGSHELAILRDKILLAS